MLNPITSINVLQKLSPSTFGLATARDSQGFHGVILPGQLYHALFQSLPERLW